MTTTAPAPAVEWQIAPAGHCGARCWSCNTIQPESADAGIAAGNHRCVCGEYLISDLLIASEVLIRADNALFQDEQAVRDNIWWHATKHDAWHSNILSVANEIPMVHLGTLTAAMRRKSDVTLGAVDDYRYEGEGDWYLYGVRLKDDAVIHPFIVPDQDESAPNTVDQYDGVNYSQVTRYVNRWEGIGSISLVVDPRCIEIVSCARMD